MAVLSPSAVERWYVGASGGVRYVDTLYTVYVVLITVGAVKVLDGMMISRVPTCVAPSQGLYPLTSSVVSVVLLTVVTMKVLNGLVWWWLKYVTATSHSTGKRSKTRARSTGPLTPTDRRMETRTVATQSMCTYKWKWKKPEFKWIEGNGDGVWID